MNVAAVGINGQGGINTRAVMSQNIVAICDCDTTLLDGRLQAWKTQADRMAVPAGQDPNAGWPAAGRAPAAPAPAGPAEPADRRRRRGATSRRRRRSSRPTRAGPAEDQNATLQRFANEQMPRLKKYQDYREMFEQAEGHRRGDHRDARSHARADRVGGDGARQAHLRAEADVLVGGRGASSRQAGGRRRKSSR